MGRPVRRWTVAGTCGSVGLHPLRLPAGRLRPGRVDRARAGTAPRRPARRRGQRDARVGAPPAARTGGRRDVAAPAADDEDVHTTLERALIDLTGTDVGGRIRAGRSRNDQIATLVRLFLRDQMRVVSLLTLDLIDVLVAPGDPARRRRSCPAAPTCSTPSRCARSPPARARVGAAPRRRALGRPRPPSDAEPLRCSRPGRQHLGPRPRAGGRRSRLLAGRAQLPRRARRRATWWRRRAGSWR